MEVVRHETEDGAWEVARRRPARALAPYVQRAIEGWTKTRGAAYVSREIPFPGVPLILNLGARWTVDGGDRDSFLAGLSDRATMVEGAATFSCVELRLTPLGAHRLLGLPMHELTNRAEELDDLLPAAELGARLRDTHSWAARFDLVERFLLRRIEESRPHADGVEWAWRRLVQTGGRQSIRSLAQELGWSQRRLIARFREGIGLPPKAAARVIRFDRCVAELRAGVALAETAHACGYFDQAHLNRDFRRFAGTTPTAFLSKTSGAMGSTLGA